MPSRRSTPTRRIYTLYVIELTDGSLYVGSSSLDPEERFRQHVDGILTAYPVKRYGPKRLRSDLAARRHAFSRPKAEEIEQELAATLRRRGYCVWQG